MEMNTETEKKKKTAAQQKATANYEKKAYFKTLLRIRAEHEKTIRAAAEQTTGGSLNGYIVRAIMEQLKRDGFQISED